MNKLKRITAIISMFIFITATLVGCKDVEKDTAQKNYDGRAFYEIFVRSFNDSNGDGIGDIKGITEKLDYLQELGVKGIWLMPINQSGSYHGYDVDDYYAINKDYGTFEDLQELLEEAHKKDIKIIMDLVVNHTSINNKWFINARQDKNSEYRDYYIWTDDMTKKNEMSPMNTKSWSQNGDKNELYYSIFWSGMPDLNMDNPKVVQEVKNIAKFYLDKGMDGFRVDAAKWIFLEKDKNVAFWKDFNDYIKSVNKDSILVGEVWDSPYNIVDYTKSLDSFFEFSIGDYAIDRINAYSISGFPDDYNGVNEIYKDTNSDFVMAPFLKNHDQSRINDSFSDDYQMKMAAAMYLTLPGTPYIYYGEEIGMSGSGADERKREPFIWDSSDNSKNTSWEKSTNDASKVAVNVEKEDKKSILNFYKSILDVRNNYKSLRYGTVKSINTSDNNIMAMERSYEEQTAYVLINGNDKEGTAKVPDGKYQVVYSNKDKNGTVKSDGDYNLDKEEILIIIKK